MLVCGGSQPRSLYCFVVFQRRQEGPNHEEQGGATAEFGSRCHAANVRLRERSGTNVAREFPPSGGDRSGIHSFWMKPIVPVQSFCSSKPLRGEVECTGKLWRVPGVWGISVSAEASVSEASFFPSERDTPWHILLTSTDRFTNA